MRTDLEQQLARFAEVLDREAPTISVDDIVSRGTVAVDGDPLERPVSDPTSIVDGVPWVGTTASHDGPGEPDVLIELDPAVVARRPAWRRVALKVALGVAAVLALVVTLATIEQGGDETEPADDLPSISLPIEYPAGKELPDLGETPGPLAAVWLAKREGGAAPEFVGLVAETGTFGTIPIELPDVAYDDGVDDPWPSFALSRDGRRIAYYVVPGEELIVRDLVSGETYAWDYELRFRDVTGWVDADHLFGIVYPGSDAAGYLWKPGTPPERVDWYSVAYGDSGLSVPYGGLRSCSGLSPVVVQDVAFREEHGGDWAGSFDVPVLCDVVGVTDSGLVLGHWKDQRDGNGTVVALDVEGADPPLGTPSLPADPGDVFDDPALRHVVVPAGAPDRVTFATDLIEEALESIEFNTQ